MPEASNPVRPLEHLFTSAVSTAVCCGEVGFQGGRGTMGKAGANITPAWDSDEPLPSKPAVINSYLSTKRQALLDRCFCSLQQDEGNVRLQE